VKIRDKVFRRVALMVVLFKICRPGKHKIGRNEA
jgi:hypothetical protein